MFEVNVKNVMEEEEEEKEQDQLGFGVLITKKYPTEIRPQYILV